MRRPRFDIGPDIGRHWFAGRPVPTHLVNALNFVFPEGERFFIRSVRFYADSIEDPELRARVAAFAGQEAQHQRAHMAAFSALEAHGYDVAGWLAWYEEVGVNRVEPRIPPVLRLATTAALEHFTASFGELALDTELLDDAHPAMRALLRWHAAEEIEHRDVAFDVLLAVDPRWRVRAGGFVLGVVVLGGFWGSAYRHLMRQEASTNAGSSNPADDDPGGARRVRAFWRARGPDFARSILRYLHPDFHPRGVGSDHLAEAFFAELAG